MNTVSPHCTEHTHTRIVHNNSGLCFRLCARRRAHTLGLMGRIAYAELIQVCDIRAQIDADILRDWNLYICKAEIATHTFPHMQVQSNELMEMLKHKMRHHET